MRQRTELPDYRVVSFKLQMDLFNRLTASAKNQERSLAREMAFRLRRSFEDDPAEADAAA